MSVYLDPENLPKEIMLQWNDGSWEHRAYWGEQQIDWGKDGSASRKRMGDLPPPASGCDWKCRWRTSDSSRVPRCNGWAFTQFDGTVYWDQAGIVRRDVCLRIAGGLGRGSASDPRRQGAAQADSGSC